jgi:hypothetical protein
VGEGGGPKRRKTRKRRPILGGFALAEVRAAARRGWDQDRVSLPGMPCRMLAGRVASRPDLVQPSDKYPSVILRLFLTKTLITNKRKPKTEG